MDTIYSLFQKVVKEHENAPAIIENDRTMTFGELSNMVDMITCSFPQEVHSIGIVMRHRTEMIASILAVLKCGGQYVPAEPDFPTGRIHDMMTEAQVVYVRYHRAAQRCLCHQPQCLPLCPCLCQRVPSRPR